MSLPASKSSGESGFADPHRVSVAKRLALVALFIGVLGAEYLILLAVDALWPSLNIRIVVPPLHRVFWALLPLLAAWNWLRDLPPAQGWGLVRPRARDVLLGSVYTAAFQLSVFGLLLLLGVKFSANGLTVSLLLRSGVTAVIFAPVVEEILVRGIAYDRLAGSRLGILGAIVATSLVWTLMHVGDGSHPMIFAPFIFLYGLLLGWLRQRSGSTLVTMLAHAQFNLTVYLFWAAMIAGWLSLT